MLTSDFGLWTSDANLISGTRSGSVLAALSFVHSYYHRLRPLKSCSRGIEKGLRAVTALMPLWALPLIRHLAQQFQGQARAKGKARVIIRLLTGASHRRRPAGKPLRSLYVTFEAKPHHPVRKSRELWVADCHF
jgi:hypothetical protein